MDLAFSINIFSAACCFEATGVYSIQCLADAFGLLSVSYKQSLVGIDKVSLIYLKKIIYQFMFFVFYLYD